MHQQEPQTTNNTNYVKSNPEKLKSWLNPKVEKYTHARAPKKDKKVGWFFLLTPKLWKPFDPHMFFKLMACNGNQPKILLSTIYCITQW